MKALVTGARGFIGSFLVEKLIENGYEVKCILRKKGSDLKWLNGLSFEQVEGDILHPDSLKDAVADVDIIFHLAGCTKALRREEYYNVNVTGTQNLLDAVVKFNPSVKRFVHVSSLAAAGPSFDGRLLKEGQDCHPVSHYGKSKCESEKVVIEFFDKLPITMVRPPAVFGPRDRDVLTYFKYGKKGILPILAGGERTASFVYVKDLVNGIILAAENNSSVRQTYYLCDEKPYTWDEFGGAIASELNVKTRRLVMPVFLSFWASFFSELFSRFTRKPSILSLDKYKEIKMNHWVCSSEKAKKELGFKPEYGLGKGIKETAEWYLANGWL